MNSFYISLLLLLFSPAILIAKEDSKELFVRRVQPLLVKKCLSCHGEKQNAIEGGFDLRSREEAFRGGDGGESAIIAGKPDASPLIRAVMRSDDAYSAMPPKEAEKLSPEEIGWLRDWIQLGADWPTAEEIESIRKGNSEKWNAEDGIEVATSGGLSPEWTSRRYNRESLWAYQPIVKPKTVASGSNAIDELIATKLPLGMKPAPRARPFDFIRRATFDLTGLPPTADEIAKFQSEYDANPANSMEALIERLLSSEHYGEKMAQHWLDVVRYADSSGFSNDFERGNAWRYRDYVVRSFNQDKPFDQFAREQIAGDENPNATGEQIIATGFLRMGPWELTGMEVPKIARQRFLDDVTNSVGETFLAHSLQCARCHDHKFDPVPTRDYYSLQANFATTQMAERQIPFLDTENISGFAEKKFIELRRSEYQRILERLDTVLLENAEKWFAEHKKDPSKWREILAKLSETGKGNPGERFNQARNVLMQQGLAETEFPPKLVDFTPEQFGLDRVARKGLERLRWELERYEPYALSVYNGKTPELRNVSAPLRMPSNRWDAGELESSAILVGGDPFSVGERVSPGAISLLSEIEINFPTSPEGRRTALAQWITSSRNPLTARVIVNRVWMWHFGEPLVGNPNNFGSTGKPPTHPELLDWLAATLVEQGWSMKALHRIIMNSEAYRRSVELETLKLSNADRESYERAFALFRPRRLSAEEIRDSMLSATGELNRTIGGIPDRPEIHLEVALQPRMVMGTFANAWVPNALPEQRHRRSIYALKLRGLLDPQMEVFNSPAPDFSCERRDVSQVTPQVFAMFNSEASYTRSLVLASRITNAIRLGTIESRSNAIHKVFQQVLSRAPSEKELELCLKHWDSQTQKHSSTSVKLQLQPKSVVRSGVEENTGERFSFEEQLYENTDFVPDVRVEECDAETKGLAEVCLVLLNTSEFLYVY